MKYYIEHNVLYSEIDWACSAYGAEERRIKCFGGETWGKETTLETQA
jgi:hypothetical protein